MVIYHVLGHTLEGGIRAEGVANEDKVFKPHHVEGHVIPIRN